MNIENERVDSMITFLLWTVCIGLFTGLAGSMYYLASDNPDNQEWGEYIGAIGFWVTALAVACLLW